VNEEPDVGYCLLARAEVIAEVWYRAIAWTSFTPQTPTQLRAQLTSFTAEAVRVLLSEPFDPRPAETIGAGVAQMHYVQPEALGQTHAVLARELLAGLPAEVAGALHPRLDALLGAVAVGFFTQARTLILEAQEAIQGALLRAREQAEAALRLSEERLATVVTQAPIVLFALDRAGVFTLLVGQGLRTLGLTEGELVGRSVFEVYRDEPAIVEQVRQALGGATVAGTMELQGRVFETRYTPLRDAQGAVSGTIGVATDITARQRAEEARLALDQLKTDFVANISHELRTPLHHIKGYAALLRMHADRLDAATQAEFLETIDRASNQLGRLIDDLVDTARMASGTLTVVRAPLRLDGLVARVVQRWAGIGSHVVRVAVPEDVPPVEADAGRLEQVLDNLLTNVVRYTPAGTEAEVGVAVTPGAVVVGVADHGPGVASEHLPHLFERFYQVPGAGGPQRGNGLGLAICQWIVEQHGGQIWAEPTAGGGLTIRFSVPRADGQAGGTPEAATEAALAGT
jgi:PAS domain S-box-containing protein